MKRSDCSYDPSVFVCPDIGMAGSVWDFKMGRDVDACDSTHMRAVKHCKKKKSALKADWKKNPVSVKKTNQHQFCIWIFSLTLATELS